MAKRKGSRLVRWMEVLLLLTVIGGGIFALRFGFDRLEEQTYPIKYESLVTEYAQKNELPLELVYAVILTESGFRSEATSSVGAMGLMQIMPEAYDWVRFRQGLEPAENKEALYEPEENIAIGTTLLRLLRKELHSVENTLAAYHAGRGRVLQWLDNPEYAPDGETVTNIPFPDTRDYVEKVTKRMEGYRSVLEKSGAKRQS